MFTSPETLLKPAVLRALHRQPISLFVVDLSLIHICLGQVVNARVIGLSGHGSLNLSLKPRAYQAIDDDAKQILELLKRAPQKQLPLPDKSSPEEIKELLGISKGQFKRAVGHLLNCLLYTSKKGTNWAAPKFVPFLS